MLCVNCGKEIPDGSLFCGYCGAKQTDTETKEEIVLTLEPDLSDIKQQEEEEPIEADIEEAEIVEPEEPVVETVQEEISTQAEEKPEGEKRKPFSFRKKKEPEEGKADVVKEQKVKAEDFKPILSVLRNPFEKTAVGWPLTGALLVILLAINWLVFRDLGGFGSALAITLVMFAGTFLILFINDSRHFSLRDLCGQSAAVMSVPGIVLLLAGIVSLFARTSSYAFATVVVLGILAMILYVLILEAHASNLARYLLAVLVAVLFALIVILQINTLTSQVFASMLGW